MSNNLIIPLIQFENVAYSQQNYTKAYLDHFFKGIKLINPLFELTIPKNNFFECFIGLQSYFENMGFEKLHAITIDISKNILFIYLSIFCQRKNYSLILQANDEKSFQKYKG